MSDTASIGSDPLRRGPFRVRARPSCAICGHPGTPLHADVRDLVFHTPGEWDLAHCTQRSCGTLWLDPFPEPDEIGKFYESYYTHSEPDSEDSQQEREDPPNDLRASAEKPHEVSEGWRTLLRMRRRSGLTHLESLPPGRVLDVGAGSGAFLVAARASGWQVRGCDFDVHAASTAMTKGAIVDSGAIEDIGYDDASFDAVTANNVIEHVPDARKLLQEACRVLAPSGKFVSVSPNPASLLHRKYGADWRGLEVPRHLFLYTPRTLKRLALEAGFRRVLATSSSADLAVMETESQKIRQTRIGVTSVGEPVPGWQQRALTLAGVLGSSLGEMTIVICEK